MARVRYSGARLSISRAFLSAFQPRCAAICAGDLFDTPACRAGRTGRCRCAASPCLPGSAPFPRAGRSRPAPACRRWRPSLRQIGQPRAFQRLGQARAQHVRHVAQGGNAGPGFLEALHHAPRKRSKRPPGRGVVAVAQARRFLLQLVHQRIGDLLRQIARGGPFAAQRGEHAIQRAFLAMIHQLGAAADIVTVLGTVTDQRTQAGIEEFDLVARQAGAAGRYLRKVARKPSISLSLTATVAGSPVKGVSVVASKVWPRQGRAKRWPAAGLDGQRGLADAAAPADECPWSGSACARRLRRSPVPGTGRPRDRPPPARSWRGCRNTAPVMVSCTRAAFDLAVPQQQPVRRRHNWRWPRHGRRRRSGFPARCVRALYIWAS